MSWPLVKLKDVAEINPRLPKNIDEAQEVTFLPMASISEQGQVLEQEKRILGETRKGFTYFEKNDVVVAKITPCFENGKAAYLDCLETQIGFGTTEFHVIRANIEKLDGKYLFYLVWNKWFRHLGERNMSGSAGQKRVPSDFLKDLKIPLPPLDEQKRIAAILDKADTIRRKRQQAIQLADDFLRSVFLDMFGDPVTNPKGWEVSTLGKLACSFQNGTGKSKQFYGRGNKVANIGDLYEKPFFSPKKYSLLEVSEKEIQKYKLNRGDLLFVRSSVKREGVAFCSAYDSDELCLFSSFMIRMSVDKEKVEPKFLSIQLRVNSMRQQLIEASNTATITNINQEGLSKVRIIVPNIAAQQRFLLISEKVNELLERSDLSSISTNSCFNSLSQKAFAGEL